MNEKERSGNPKNSHNRRPRFLWLALIAVGVLGLGALFVAWVGSGSGPAYSGPTTVAERGDLTISVTEFGSLRSSEQVIVTNQVEGRTTLIWIIDEGTQVEKGDLLAELDSSELQNQLTESRIEVQNAEAAFIGAREALEISKSQNESDIAAAELTLRLAKLDLASYIGNPDLLLTSAVTGGEEETADPTESTAPEGATGGDYAQQRQQLMSEIQLAEEELTRAEEQYENSRELADQGFITELEVEGDRLAMERARVDLRLAKGQLHLLENYTHRRDLEQLQSDVAQAERALERVILTANSNLIQAQADFDAARQEWEEEQRELAEVEEQIKFCKIYAPAAGMVVYETSTNSNRWGNDEPLEAGQEVRERQELIYLPAPGAMIADITVHESSLDEIAIGMPARVTVDANQGAAFDGTVTRIAPMPDATSIWLNPDLTVYSTQVQIDSTTESLRTGMSCRVEIIIDELKDVVYVPLQSVVRYEGRHYVYVLGAEGPEARPVEIGQDNNRVVHIKSGIESGEVVLLAPPIHERMETEEEAQEMDPLVPEGLDGGESAPPAEGITTAPDGAERSGAHSPGTEQANSSATTLPVAV